jgi:glycosyltransferase involved in cell wall biosynthesis
MSTDPKYSIIIPTKDGMPYLRFAVLSVLAPKRTDVELLVSVDSSGAETDDFLAGINDSRLRIIRPGSPLSMSEHWNFAQSHARGAWQMFLGQDDLVMTDYLEALDRLTKSADGHQTQVAVSRRAYVCWPPLRSRDLKALQYWRTDEEKVIASRDFLEEALTSGISYHAGPQMYTTTVVHKDLVTKIRASQEGALICGHPQDAFLAASILRESPNFLWSGSPLSWVGTSEKSAGLAITNGESNPALEKLAKSYTASINSEIGIRYRSKVDFRHGINARYLYDALVSVWPEVLQTSRLGSEKFKRKMDSSFMASFQAKNDNGIERQHVLSQETNLVRAIIGGQASRIKGGVVNMVVSIASKVFKSRLQSKFGFHQIKSIDDAAELFVEAMKIKSSSRGRPSRHAND